MLSTLLNTCVDCDELEAAMCEMDGAIAKAGQNGYYNLVYLSNKQTYGCDMMRLIWYREILNQLKCNAGYYCPQFTFADIVSRARALVAGMPKIAKRWTLPVYTTTTTTTSTTTSTSTTTTTTTNTP